MDTQGNIRSAHIHAANCMDPELVLSIFVHFHNLMVSDQQTLTYAVWQRMAQEHRCKAEGWTIPYRSRRTQGKLHPIHDFLFIYYRFAPSHLEHWHPSFGTCLEVEQSVTNYSKKYYSHNKAGLFQDLTKIDAKARKRLQWSYDLCCSVERRTAQFNCFGMHEWAMVYKGGPEGRPRHEGKLALRLPQKEIDALVEKNLICCSHFDAFRFFTDVAKPFKISVS